MTLVFVQGRYNEWVQGTSLRLPSPVGGEPSIRSDAVVIMICLYSQWHPLVAIYIKSGSLTATYMQWLIYWWWLRPVVFGVCMSKISSPVTFRASICSTHDHLHQPIRLIDSCNNKLFVHDHRWPQSSRLPLSYCNRLRTTCLECSCIIRCTIVVIPYTHTQLHCLCT